MPTLIDKLKNKLFLNGSFVKFFKSKTDLYLNFFDLNNDPVNVDSVSGDDVTLDITPDEGWWQRNPDWLDMPTVTAGDNVLYGLYAVYENGFNTNIIDKNGTASLIDWGDGTTVTSTGTEQHTYDYATLGGSISVDETGRNYKQVIVQIDIPSDCNVLGFASNETTPPTGTFERTIPWLDVVGDFTGTTGVTFRPSFNSRYSSRLLERVKILGRQANINNGAMSELSSLQVWDVDTATYNVSNVNSGFRYSSDFRDSDGNAINFNFVIDGRSCFNYSGITKLGDINYLGTGDSASRFLSESSIQEVGNIDLSNITSMSNFSQKSYRLRKVGTITVDNSLTTLSAAFANNFSLLKVEFLGDLSGVTNTSVAFRECHSLYRLLLPNITIGFDIRDTQITGQNLQDLGNSIGNANGAQTITLPNFVNGQDVSVFTNKGYTIAYA